MNPIITKIGDMYGNFTIISDVYKNHLGYRVVKCKCNCGVELEIYVSNLRKINKCKKCTAKTLRKYNSGDKIGLLTVIDYLTPSNGHSKLLVSCECSPNDIYEIWPSTLNEIKQCRDCYVKKQGFEHGSYKGTRYVSKSYFTLLKYNALKKNREFSITIKYIDDILIKQNHKCSLSGLHIKIGSKLEETTASLDRIDSNQGYVEGNVQWVHKDINRMKTDFDEHYFIQLCKMISANK